MRVQAVAALLVMAIAIAHVACGPVGWQLPAGVPLLPVVVPRGGEADSASSLVDGRVEPGGWYCAVSRSPLRFELMFADGETRAIRAVAFVPGNLGPRGVGTVEIRVQRGHGVAAQGEDFRAELRGRAGVLHVVRLPEAAMGDRVLLTLERDPAWSTAGCVAEIAAYTGEPAPLGEAVVALGERIEHAGPGR